MNNEEIEILLIEDSDLDAEITIRALRKSNVAENIVRLDDGAEALDFLFGNGDYADRNTAHKPKLILLDLKMPKVDGIEVLEKIKANPDTSRIPVVVLTSSREDPDIDKCYRLGANSYIVKPVGFDNFSKAISQLGMYWMLINQPPTL
jgi:two-component system response regulator